ncbi:MAG: S41 family peptidase [Crocinitomicaceae bacterium]|nr:S41 family peptidase [Crocinitomicaceae bacterium]
MKIFRSNKFLSRAITIVLISISSVSHSQSNGFEVVRSLELMDQIYEYLEKYYVDDLNAGSLSKTAIDAMLKELDPYTVYYHETDIEDYRLMTTGQYGGIGALIRKMGEYTYISEPYEGNPAHNSGLMAGDKILEIDGEDMKGKPSSEVSTALKGPKATKVNILVERNGGEEVSVSFERAEIKIPDVPYSGMINETVGYIKLSSFTKTASQEVIKAYGELTSEGMQKLVFDLRGNGGGLLIESVKIVNMFIPNNEIVVTTKGRVAEENRSYKTMNDPVDLDIPVVILVDGGSASASEIVSGSLQDLDRAVIIGTQSYGKGLVQRTYDLDYGSKMKLTIAKYYTPSGRCVQRLEYYDKLDGEGVEEIPDSLIQIFKTANGRDVIDGRGVEPDVEVDVKEFSRLTATLFREHLVFDYSTNYFFAHREDEIAVNFSLTTSDYEAFKNFVLEHEFTYSTASEEMLKKMKKTAEEEGFYDDMETEYDLLLEKVVPSKERDLEKFKPEIMHLIENEIVSRYHFQKGRAKHAFKDDKYIQAAIEVFNKEGEYDTILGN